MKLPWLLLLVLALSMALTSCTSAGEATSTAITSAEEEQQTPTPTGRRTPETQGTTPTPTGTDPTGGTPTPTSGASPAFTPREMSIPEGWPMWGSDQRRSNSLPLEEPLLPPLQVRWRFPTESWSASSPVVADGLVYFGSSDGRLYAVDARTGKPQWSYETGGPVLSTAAVTNGTVFVGSMDHFVYALDARTGDPRWRFETGSWVVSSPLLARGLVVAGSGDGRLYALDAVNGSLVWSFETDGWVVSSPATDGDTLVAASWGGTVYGLDLLTGEERWRVDLGEPVVATPLVADGKVFVPSLGDTLNLPFPSLISKGIDLLARTGIFDVGEVMGPALDLPYLSTIDRNESAGGTLHAIDITSGQALWEAPLRGWAAASPPLFVPPEGATAEPTPTPPGVGAPIEERAQAVERQLTCPVCPQDQNLEEAQGALADQMRQVIRQKLEEGKSDQAILDFFVERYGDSVLYTAPPTLQERSVVLSTPAGYKYGFSVDTGESTLEIAHGNVGPAFPSALIVGRSLYAVNVYGQGQIYDLAGGGQVGSFSLPARDEAGRSTGSFSSPALVNGMLYVVTEDGQLAAFGSPAFELEVTEEPAPLALGGETVAGKTVAKIRLAALEEGFSQRITLKLASRWHGSGSLTATVEPSALDPGDVATIVLEAKELDPFMGTIRVQFIGVADSGGVASVNVPVTMARPTPTPTTAPEQSAQSAQGRQLVQAQGCLACHTTDGSQGVAPTWKGLFGSVVPLQDGTQVQATETYLRESIMTPNAKVVRGFPSGVMPQDFADRLSEEEIDAIIAYIKSLQ